MKRQVPVKMRALMEFPYNHGQVKAGDEFEAASKNDAEALKLFGRAELVEEDEINNPKRRRYARRDMTAQE